jgi:glucose/mannose-6-phosphate isomerase
MPQIIDLDDRSEMTRLDPLDMLAEIDSLPDQLLTAYQLGTSFNSSGLENPRILIMAGMGGSAIGADLVSAYVKDKCRVPLFVQREYDLPAWAQGKDVLVVVSSHSGNTEESLEVFEQAHKNQCRLLAICTGGALEQKALNYTVPVWKFVHEKQPRAAVGYSFGLQIALLRKLDLIPDPVSEISRAVDAMNVQKKNVAAEVPVSKNPAKRMAGQMLGRLVTVVGSDVLAPVARRWSTQINELAKTWSQFEIIPELNHNAIAGAGHPEDLIEKRMVIFLRAASQSQRNKERIDLTMQRYLSEGLFVDYYNAKGESLIDHMWTMLHFGDYVSYYLAVLNGVDPTHIESIAWLKQKMQHG